MTTDYTRNEIDILIDLIREDNERKTLTTGQVTFGMPNDFTPVQGVERNTVIIATSIPGRGYEGSQSFYYNRRTLNDFVPPDNPEVLEFTEVESTKVSELLPLINERLGINLTADKIEDRDIPDLESSGQSYVEVILTMRPDSLVYKGQLTLRIVGTEIPLIEAIPDPIMDGLIYAPPQAA